jgi:hypothetical protein
MLANATQILLPLRPHVRMPSVGLLQKLLHSAPRCSFIDNQTDKKKWHFLAILDRF